MFGKRICAELVQTGRALCSVGPNTLRTSLALQLRIRRESFSQILFLYEKMAEDRTGDNAENTVPLC
jgi:glutamate 5-kinase